MKTVKRFLILFIIAVLLRGMSITVYAHDVPDLSQKGIIGITMKCGNSVVSGGTLTLYHVGKVEEKNGNFIFALTDEFIGSGILLENIESADLAQSLGRYAMDNKVIGETKSIASDGTITFSDLEPGLYLLVQNKAAEGYYRVTPFLVSVPMYDAEKEEYLYHVDASPKVEIKKVPEEPETPEETETPEEPETPEETETPDEPGTPEELETPEETEMTEIPGTPAMPQTPGAAAQTLPQTGQLNWPIPVLTALGLALFTTGWIMCNRKKKDGNEK